MVFSHYNGKVSTFRKSFGEDEILDYNIYVNIYLDKNSRVLIGKNICRN